MDRIGRQIWDNLFFSLSRQGWELAYHLEAVGCVITFARTFLIGTLLQLRICYLGRESLTRHFHYQ